MKEAAELAESTQILMSVSEFTDVSQATDTLISAVQAFGYTADTSMEVVDLLNTIGNNYAISTADLAQSLTKSSASLVAAGGDLAEAAALTATANAIIQDADSVGTALKTTSLRLRGTDVKVLEEEGLDSEGAVTSKSKLQSKVKALSGVDILTATGEYKSTYEILSDIADVWESMNDMDQAALLELISGKRNSSVIAAILQNPQELKDAYEDAMDAEGSALKENEKYLDSIQGKIDQFNNAMQAMWSDTLDSDIVKGFVELATQLIKIVYAVGPLNIALVGFFTFLEKKHGFLSNFFKPAEDGVEALKKQLVKAEQDLAKATEDDLQHGSKKTAQERRDAQDRVDILRKQIDGAEPKAPVDPELDALIGDRDSLAREVDAIKARREELAKAVESDSPDDMLKLVEIDTTSIDDEIEEAQGKLEKAKKSLVDAQAEPATRKVNGGVRMNKDRDIHIADASQEIADIENSLDSLQQKKADTIRYAAQFDLADMDNTIGEASTKLDGMTAAISAKTAAQTADNAATVAGVAADNASTGSKAINTAATWKDVLATAASKDATFADVGAKLKQLLIMKLLSMEYVKNKIKTGELTAAKLADFTMTELLTLGMKGLVASLWAGVKAAVAFIVSLGPVAWITIGVVAAVATAVAVFAHFHKTTAELKEELDGLKSELSDIGSELDSVNSELKTTNERMAELLAKEKLTFEEQEELDRLRATNDELERRKTLLESEKEYKTGQVGRQAARTVESAREDRKWWDTLWRGTGWGMLMPISPGTNEERFTKNIDDYKTIKEKFDNASSLEEQNKYQKELDKKSAEVDEYISELSEALDGVKYGDSEESDEALDYLAEIQDIYGIARGSASAKTNAIKGILNKDEFAETKTAIDGYVDALAKGDKNATAYINKIINKNTDLVDELKARGLEAQDAVDYFAKLGSEANYATIDGKIKEVSRAADTFESLINGGKFKVDDVDIGLADLFDEEGKIIQTKLSQVFNDTSEQTREDITRLLEGSYDQIKNGTVDVERLLSGFALKTTQQVLEIQNKVLGEQNLELFPNLKDEIDVIIDKFSEFSAAVGSVVDALDTLEQARAEEAYSGSVSIETLENLMKYTDDYSQLVEIDETGAIRLATDAEQILIEQRLQKIKTDAAAAVRTAQSNLEQAKYNAKAVNETGPVQEALTSATDGLAGAWAYLGSIIGDITDGNFSGIFERASAAYGNVTAGREKKRTQVNVSVEDAEKALENALNQQKIANALTSENVKSKHSSDEASGGNGTKDEVENDAFQREMDYWENRIGANQAKYEQLQNEIDLMESKGQKANAAYYREQITLENQRMHLLQGQKRAAKEYLATLDEGSEEWWEAANTLNDIEGEIDGVTASIVDLQDAIDEINVYKFDEYNTRLDNITGKLGTIRDLIAPNGEEDWFDDEGNWTEAGVAVLGSHIQELETYKQGYQKTVDEMAKYAEGYDGNENYYESMGIHSEQEYYDKVESLTDQQYDYAKSISDTEQSVVDMYESSIDAVEEYVDTLIDGYNDYIDSVKEALSAERD